MNEENIEEIAKAAEETVVKKSAWQTWKSATWKENRGIYVIREILSYILIFVVAFIVALFVNIYIFRFSAVVGHSMDKTYHNGQRVTLSRIPYIFGEPKRGDVVILDSTKQNRNIFVEIDEAMKTNLIAQKVFKVKSDVEHQYYIKRVIGIAGDKIEVKENKIYLNGELLDEPYVNPEVVPDYSVWEGIVWEVPEKCVFVMGDNRNRSQDSRFELGFVPKQSLLGRVFGDKYYK